MQDARHGRSDASGMGVFAKHVKQIEYKQPVVS